VLELPLAGDACPCGGELPYGGCCGPLLEGGPAATAEALMRSRYTAYVVGDVDHLVRTWHPRTRPAGLDLDPGLRWTGLEVLDTADGGPDDETGDVEFRARWRDHGAGGVLHERSTFARRGGRWTYVDGDVR
jgi:SEC-C motif-containing protein